MDPGRYEVLRSTRPTARTFLRAGRDLPGGQGTLAGGTRPRRGRKSRRLRRRRGGGLPEDRRIRRAADQAGSRVLTHCNAGWLAAWTGGRPGAALHGSPRRVIFSVYADETRPRCQGANLTAWELAQEGVPCHIIADNAAGLFMRRGEIQLVITRADRIAATATRPTRSALTKRPCWRAKHASRFYIAAPLSTFDRKCPTGDSIPIEERGQDEVLYVWG